MKDFVKFVQNFGKLYYATRGLHLVVGMFLAVSCMMIKIFEPLTFGEAAYLTAITALTIGYGDLSPTTGTGRAVAVLIGIIGVLHIGILVAIATRAVAMSFEKGHGSK